LGKQSNNRGPTVYVIDDDAPVRDSLRLLLESLGKNVETFASAQEFLDQSNEVCCGCLVLDIRMPGIDGMELQDILNGRGLYLPIIFITGHGEVPTAVTAMRKGAFDFIQKPFVNQDLIGRIDAALEFDDKNRELNQKQKSIEQCLASLTERELEVLRFITEGKSNKSIALELHVSQRTVEAHRAHIMEKMQAKSLPHLVRMAMTIETMQWPQNN